VSVQAVASLSANQTTAESSTGRLAAFFPEAMPVRIPVRVTAVRDRGDGWSEETVIEFATPLEVIFASKLSLEFEDEVRIESTNGLLSAQASVVAVQYENGQRAVAARFSAEVANWIVKR
jgi:hypothetical protein